MEVKKVVIEDGKYTCDIGKIIEEWKNILLDKTLTTDNIKDVLIKFHNEPEHKSTCKALGEKYNQTMEQSSGSLKNKKKLNYLFFGRDKTRKPKK